MPHQGRPIGRDLDVIDERRPWVIAHLRPEFAACPSTTLPGPAPLADPVAGVGVLPRAITVALAVLALLGVGVARRRLTDDAGSARWLATAAARVSRMLPTTAGTWIGTEVVVDPQGLEGAGIAALSARRYVDPTTGAAVTAVLLCGRPGPIAAHGPEACYPGAGFTPLNKPRRRNVSGLGNTFWSADFSGGSAEAPRVLNVSWAWADRHGWSAPDNPRLRFAAAPVLFKLYLLHEPDPRFSDDDDLPSLRLAAHMLPGLNTTTAPKP